MNNGKKVAILAGLVVVGIILAIAFRPIETTASPGADESSQNDVGEIKSPPQEQTMPQILELSSDDTSDACQKSSNNEYGGIGGSENNPPRGTVVDQNLTDKYGRLTATGTCGTYQYIAGWWFNESEMAKLPSRTIMYGESPYITDEGSNNGVQSAQQEQPGEPIVPVPEMASIVLVSLGILTFVVLKKYKR